jgi:hypothetical protein
MRPIVLLAALMLASACNKQYRTVPVAEVSTPTWETFPPPGALVVRDVDGRQIRIEHVGFVEVPAFRCDPPPDATWPDPSHCKAISVRFVTPVYWLRRGPTLAIVPSSADEERPHYFERVETVTLVDRDDSRAWIMAGVAVGAGAAAAFGSAAVISSAGGDSLQTALGGLLIGYGVGGLSLLVTTPMTRDLGEVIE